MEAVQLLGCDEPPVALLQATKVERPEADPLQVKDGVAHRREHAPHLPLPTLVDFDLHQRPLSPRIGADDAGTSGMGALLVQFDALAELAERRRRRNAAHFCPVGLANLVRGMRQALCQLAVVRQQEQSPGGLVEAPDGVDSTDGGVIRAEAGDKRRQYQVHHRAAGMPVPTGRDAAGRFVQDQGQALNRARQRPAVHFDPVGRRVRLNSSFPYDPPIQLHPPTRDE